MLAKAEGLSVTEVRCGQGPERSWSPPEVVADHALVLPRRGVFAREVAGRRALLDPTVAYLQRPGAVDRFAHPDPGGDVCVTVSLSPTLLATLTGGDPSLEASSVPVGVGLDVAVWRLAAATRGGDLEGSVAEQVVAMVAGALEGPFPERVASGRPATATARERLVEDARLALNHDPTVGLTALARTVGSSPHHLSRLFRAATGQTVSAYRNRLRVGRALERLAGGWTDLATLAAELGFADHAHLTRTIRAHTGQPPSHLRQVLTGR